MNGYIGTEKEYQELEKLSTKLGIPVPMMFLEREIKFGEEVVKKEKGRSHTWNRNFWNAIYSACGAPGTSATFGAGYLCNKALSGALGVPRTENLGFAVNGFWLGAIGSTAQGIVVGTGVGVESFESYAMGTLIAHGIVAGTLSYSAMAAHTASYDAPSKVWTTSLVRIMNNNSGNTINVGEIGIHSYAGFSGQPILVNRDLLGAPDVLVNGAQYTVTYTITLTFPA